SANRLLSAADEHLVLDGGAYATLDQNAEVLRDRPPRLAAGIRPVVPEIAERAAALGFVNPVTDHDGTLRREPVVVAYGRPPGDATRAEQVDARRPSP